MVHLGRRRGGRGLAASGRAKGLGCKVRSLSHENQNVNVPHARLPSRSSSPPSGHSRIEEPPPRSRSRPLRQPCLLRRPSRALPPLPEPPVPSISRATVRLWELASQRDAARRPGADAQGRCQARSAAAKTKTETRTCKTRSSRRPLRGDVWFVVEPSRPKVSCVLRSDLRSEMVGLGLVVDLDYIAPR